MKRLILVAVVVVLVGLAAVGASALSPAMATLASISPVSCATTPTKIALPVATPARSLCIQNQAAVDVYVGGSDVTTANGFLLPSASVAAPTSFCFDGQTAWCVVASSTSPVRVVAGIGYSGR